MDLDPVTVATADDALRDAALRWCAAAGLPTELAFDLSGVRARWRTSPVVLLGHDLAGSVAGAHLARRDHVLLVSRDPEHAWRPAVRLGAAGVLEVGDDATAIASLGAAFDGGAEGCTVAVVGGSGGVGATTFAAGLASESARRGYEAVVVDADPFGAGVELVLGSEHAPGLRWPDLASAEGRVSGDSLADALPRHHGVATVSWAPAAEVVAVPPTADAVWAASVRAFDLVVVDLSRSSIDLWAESVTAASVLTVVVVADDVVGVAAARRRLVVLRRSGATLAAVVARRRSGLGPGVVEETLGVPVVGSVRPDARLRVALDHGGGPRSRSLRKASAGVLDLVGLDARDRR